MPVQTTPVTVIEVSKACVMILYETGFKPNGVLTLFEAQDLLAQRADINGQVSPYIPPQILVETLSITQRV